MAGTPHHRSRKVRLRARNSSRIAAAASHYDWNDEELGAKIQEEESI
jgi:hypothetical protein